MSLATFRGSPLDVSPQPPNDGPSPRGSFRRQRPGVRLKRDWLTGGFVPAHGGIGSFLPVVKPGTPSAGRQSRSFAGGTHDAVAERSSNSQRSSRSSTSRASVSSRGNDGSRLSGRGSYRPRSISRFSGDGSQLMTTRAADGDYRTPEQLHGRALEVGGSPVHLRYNLTLGSRTPGKADLEAAVPDFLRASLRSLRSANPRETFQYETPRLSRTHDSETAKELLNALEHVHWVERGQEEGPSAARHPRRRVGLVPTLLAARSVGLRAEMEACASVLLQACVRSHIARKELRIKRQVALWGQTCHRIISERRRARVRREEMEQYGRRVAQFQYNMQPEDHAHTHRKDLEARILKQQQWGIVNDRFLTFKAQQEREKELAREEQRARDLARKRAEIEAVELRVAEEKSTFLTDAKRTVWVGHVPRKYATEHMMLPLMECLGKVVSIHIRVKKDVDGAAASWALVMFEDKQTAERSFHANVRADCGAGLTRSWSFCAIRPEKIESFQAKIALADMQVDGLEKDLEIRRKQSVADSLAKAEMRERERAERERRAMEISAMREAIERKQCAIEASDRRQRDQKQVREERKLYRQLLLIVLDVWSAYAKACVRLKALDKKPEIRQRTLEIEKLVKAGEIPLGRRDAAPAVAGSQPEDGASPPPDLLNWNPSLYVALMKTFYQEQRTLIGAFVSWKIYTHALLNDSRFCAQARKALSSFIFYQSGVRNFGIQVKLDKIDGLRDSASTHEWLSPRERHERNIARQSEGFVESSGPGSDSDDDSKTEEGESIGLSGHNQEEDRSRMGDLGEEQCEESQDDPPIRWSAAEEDLVSSIFPGALSTK